ncbi:MAG: SpoIVB peptidase S55 domain-containing protein [Terriglobia bacterium]
MAAFIIASVLPLKAQQNPQFFPVGDVRPGLKGVGRTIFEGNKVQEFQVELLGVLKNVLSPKHDAILARLSGPTIEKTGVVAGMSGSPVYVDGKLLGAVAIAFPFSKEPYTLITPIEDMLQVVPESAEQPRAAWSLPWYAASAPSSAGSIERWIPAADSGPELWSKMLGGWASSNPASRFRLPLLFGGFDASIIAHYAPLLKSLGFEPMEADVLSGGAALPDQRAAAPVNLNPGSMISMVLVRGDLNLSVDCTVTYRHGNQLYACGHEAFLLGPANVPFAEAHVLATIPSLSASFKVDAPGPVVGSIRQDRFGAIYGVVGEKAPTIPVDIHMDSSLGRTTNYHFEVAQQPLLSPLLVNMAIVSTISSTERTAGPSTLALDGKIKLSDGEAINIEDVVSSEFSSAGMAGAAVAMPLSYLLNGQFPKIGIRDIALNITARNESQTATLEQVWSTRSEVHPGDRIVVTAVERTPSGQMLTQKIPVEIPRSIDSKRLSLVVGSGTALNALQMNFIHPGSPPRNLHQLVRDLNRTRRNNRLYALLMAPQRSFVMEGTEYPSPPPSLLQTFMADPAVSSKITYRGTSVVGDSHTAATSYSIEGDETIYLKVLTSSN